MSCDTILVEVSDPTSIAQARRHAMELADKEGFSEESSNNAGIVVTEAATNILKHGEGGLLQCRIVSDGGVPELEVLAIDKGPGMHDVDACLRDGFSTSGTAGTGLGAIRRLSAEFDIYSRIGSGTVLVGRVPQQKIGTPSGISSGIVKAPARGETVCGDAVEVMSSSRGPVVVMADGLGHGPAAATASAAACRAVREHPEEEAAALLERAHLALRPTRGAAVAIACIDLNERALHYAGLGNISGALISGSGTQHLVSHNGTAGHQARRMQEFQYRWPKDAILVMHSDGLTARWDIRSYPLLESHHPATLAGVLFRDAVRGKDDATIVALRER